MNSNFEHPNFVNFFPSSPSRSSLKIVGYQWAAADSSGQGQGQGQGRGQPGRRPMVAEASKAGALTAEGHKSWVIGGWW
jgi:hypothetical protein